uniref:IPT/TIG domain-containing protein n=1 Tax=viral metagenome TaxID=1070528 RepID=A0A6C0AF29_9ZZZZ
MSINYLEPIIMFVSPSLSSIGTDIKIIGERLYGTKLESGIYYYFQIILKSNNYTIEISPIFDEYQLISSQEINFKINKKLLERNKIFNINNLKGEIFYVYLEQVKLYFPDTFSETEFINKLRYDSFNTYQNYGINTSGPYGNYQGIPYTFDLIYILPLITSSNPQNNLNGNIIEIIGSGFDKNINPYELYVILEKDDIQYNFYNISIANDNMIYLDIYFNLPFDTYKILIANSQFDEYVTSPNTYTIIK